MTIGIVGLGLIGGSLAKALRRYTDHTLWGYDIRPEVVSMCICDDILQGELTERQLPDCDIVLIAVYPLAAADYVIQNQSLFGEGTLVIDCCGVKRNICDQLHPIAVKNKFQFIGGHPMAGKESSGFVSSDETLYQGASMILTPPEELSAQTIKILETFFYSIGFRQVLLTTAQDHDSMIAYTSQLAHVVSSAYVRSPSALRHSGFSAGSFKDMTRVAKLDEVMWTELFFENKDYLTDEIDELAQRLIQYSAALKANDRQLMNTLLKEGRQIKQMLNGEVTK